MRRTKTILALLAVIAAMLVAFAAPALAEDRRDNDRFFFGDREQEAESGDLDQDFDVSQTGDNSNQTVGIQGVANTGNAQSQTGVVDGFSGNGFFFDCDDFDFDGFCDRDDDFLFFFDDNRFFGDNDGDFEFDDVGSSIEVSPTNTTSSYQEVNQAASASG